MDDYISSQAAIDEIEHELEMINSALDSITLDFNARERLRQRRGEAREILNSIQQLPPATSERKKGKWEVHDILDYAQRPTGRKIGKCPFCGYLTGEFRSRVDYYRALTNFCPNCGAYMRERGEDE